MINNFFLYCNNFYFNLQARVEVDPNGDGACIYAWVFDINKGRNSGQYVHELLW